MDECNKIAWEYPEGFSKVYSSNAKLCLERGFYDNAIAFCGKVLELDEKNVDAYFFRSEANFCKNNFEKVLADCDEIIKRDKGYLPAYERKAEAFVKMGDSDKAVETLEVLIGAGVSVLHPFLLCHHFHHLV